MMKSLNNVNLSKVVEVTDNTNLSGELACAGGSCEITQDGLDSEVIFYGNGYCK